MNYAQITGLCAICPLMGKIAIYAQNYARA